MKTSSVVWLIVAVLLLTSVLLAVLIAVLGRPVSMSF